jgi:hypothetical protein
MDDQLRGFSAEEVTTLVHLLQRFIANDAETGAVCTGGECADGSSGKDSSDTGND